MINLVLLLALDLFQNCALESGDNCPRVQQAESADNGDTLLSHNLSSITI